MNTVYKILYFALLAYYLSNTLTLFCKKKYCATLQKEADYFRELMSKSYTDSYGDITDYSIYRYNKMTFCSTIVKCLIFLFLWFKTDPGFEYIAITIVQIFSYIFDGGLDIIDKNYLSTKQEDIKYRRWWVLAKYFVNLAFAISGLCRLF